MYVMSMNLGNRRNMYWIEDMKDIKAANKMELFSILKSIDITVPPRDTTEHRETWSICRLLATLANHDRLSFPIQLTKMERPDFLIVAGGCHIGIEITDAVNQDYAKVIKWSEADIVDPALFKWGTPTRGNKELSTIVSQKKLTGPGWEGMEVESEYAEAIFDVINLKTEKLHKPGFEKFSKNWLAVYCDITLPFLNIEAASQFFVEKSVNYWGKYGFTSVFVEKGENIILYSRDQPEVMQLKNLWRTD